MNVGEAKSNEETVAAKPGLWLVAALFPVLTDAGLVGAAGFGAVLLLGSLLARERPLRWVAVAWGAATLVPPTPLLAAASAGAACRAWSTHLETALFALLTAWLIPVRLQSAGLLLILAGVLLFFLGGGDDAN